VISDEDIDDLPSDDEAAFVQFESKLRDVVKATNAAQDYRGWDIEREYVAHILAFVDRRELPLDLPRNPPNHDNHFYDWYRTFTRAVDYFKASARLNVSARRKANITSLVLGPDFKAQISGYLMAIRKIVAEAELSEGKREAILKRVVDLQTEVDRNHTRTESAFALYLEVTSIIGKGAENLKPAFERVESILKVIAKAKDDNEQKALEAPKERKQLPAPTTPPDEAPALGYGPPGDDEIPF